MRRVLRFKPGPDDGAEEYVAITNHLLNRYRTKYGWLRWDEEALGPVYDWAGHVSRFSAWAPNRLALKALLFRGARYLHEVQAMFGSQCHGKKFKVWRWEQQFARQLGKEWMESALDEEAWKDGRLTWVSGRRSYSKF